MSGGWKGSTRRERLPANWEQLRRQAHRRNPRHICHLCGAPGGDALDHKKRGDDHSPANLDWAHDSVPPHCHRVKSAREGGQSFTPLRRPPEPHPAL
jgi:5-methylcytosine-specific restriction protein A